MQKSDSSHTPEHMKKRASLTQETTRKVDEVLSQLGDGALPAGRHASRGVPAAPCSPAGFPTRRGLNFIRKGNCARFTETSVLRDREGACSEATIADALSPCRRGQTGGAWGPGGRDGTVCLGEGTMEAAFHGSGAGYPHPDTKAWPLAKPAHSTRPSLALPQGCGSSGSPGGERAAPDSRYGRGPSQACAGVPGGLGHGAQLRCLLS